MNFPDLETCKIIGAEFPNSEFAYYDGPYNEPTILKKTPDIVWKFLAFTPTCEELGEWLDSKSLEVVRLTPGVNKWVIQEGYLENGQHKWRNAKFGSFEAKNETCARAEAVRIIKQLNKEVF